MSSILDALRRRLFQRVETQQRTRNVRCTECKIKYPAGLVTDLVTTEGVRPVCGICALTITNRIHGIRRAMFSPGSEAERVRRACVAFRETLTQKK